MTDEERAAAAYAAVCDYLTAEHLGYEKDDGTKTVYITLAGKTFPAAMAIRASASAARLEVFSRLPMTISDTDAALHAVNDANAAIGAGRFILRENAVEYEDTYTLRGVEGVTADFGKAVVETAFATIQAFHEA